MWTWSCCCYTSYINPLMHIVTCPPCLQWPFQKVVEDLLGRFLHLFLLGRNGLKECFICASSIAKVWQPPPSFFSNWRSASIWVTLREKGNSMEHLCKIHILPLTSSTTWQQFDQGDYGPMMRASHAPCFLCFFTGAANIVQCWALA